MKQALLSLRILAFAAIFAFTNALVAPMVTGCTPSPVVPQPDADAAVAVDDGGLSATDARSPDETDAAIPPDTPPSLRAMCTHLRELGCAEGKAPTCEIVNAKVLFDRLTPLGPKGEAIAGDCVTRASTGADVRKCAPTWRHACTER